VRWAGDPNDQEERMTPAARSVNVFGTYLLALAVVLLTPFFLATVLVRLAAPLV
jgi:hypothetical protein